MKGGGGFLRLFLSLCLFLQDLEHGAHLSEERVAVHRDTKFLPTPEQKLEAISKMKELLKEDKLKNVSDLHPDRLDEFVLPSIWPSAMFDNKDKRNDKRKQVRKWIDLEDTIKDALLGLASLSCLVL